jgi:excisionase family DNA binding protein
MKVDKEKIMTIQGVCEYTKLSKSTIYKRIMENQIPHHKIGSRTLFMTEEIDEWIRNDGVMTDPIPEIKLINLKDHGNIQSQTG